MLRTVFLGTREITYTLTYKKVKNLNLRVKEDLSVWVSAPRRVSPGKIDEFVLSKGEFILSALERFGKTKRTALREREFASGESFRFLGRDLRLRVEQCQKEEIFVRGEVLFLRVRETGDTERKKRLAENWLKEQRISVFTAIAGEVHQKFADYRVEFPKIQIRDMSTRWGSCRPGRGAITLNARLIEYPVSCIEYVATHEFCHFVHLDHSKNFYRLLETKMPDWRERKDRLERRRG